MPIRRLLAALLAIILPIVAPARAEVPNLTPEQLEQAADDVIVGVVLHDYIADEGRRTDHITTLAILRVEKGEREAGDHINAAWYTQQLFPGTVGTSGHRGTLPHIGGVVKVYLTETGAVVLPNGFQPAKPFFVTPEVAADRDHDALRAAGLEAMKAHAYVEAERAFAALTEITHEPADRLQLGLALAGQLRFAEGADVVEPIALRADSPDEPEELRRTRAEARRAYAFMLWETGDDAAFAEGIAELAGVDERFAGTADFIERE